MATPALDVVEAQAAPAELLSQNAIFFAKIVDDLQLTLVHPAGDGDQPEPEWDPALPTCWFIIPAVP